jgi:hypothetical protein
MLLGTAIPTVRHKNFVRDFEMGTGTYQSLFLLHLMPIKNPGGAQELAKKRQKLACERPLILSSSAAARNIWRSSCTQDNLSTIGSKVNSGKIREGNRKPLCN